MEDHYTKPDPVLWSGRKSGRQEYLHEKVTLSDAREDLPFNTAGNTYALLGYACDEGVRRNLGRPGAAEGPDAIRRELGKMANHLPKEVQFLDLGNIHCPEGNVEESQEQLAAHTAEILKQGGLPLLLGGGHDISYGHYQGLRRGLGSGVRLGIINFDAHFDLRSNEIGNHSGSPFFQIAQQCTREGDSFEYLCLGIRKEANPPELFSTAEKFDVQFLGWSDFSIRNLSEVKGTLNSFLSKVDKLYVTIDMDGFSSAYSPGVSASSPVGFNPDIVFACLEILIDSGKIAGLDVAETNPSFDHDGKTAKLAAGMLHYVMHQHALL